MMGATTVLLENMGIAIGDLGHVFVILDIKGSIVLSARHLTI